MMDFLRALSAELLKLKRTAALLVALISLYVVVTIFFLFTFFEGGRIFGSGQIDAWRWLAESTFVTWAGFFLPLAVGLETALAAAIEHRADGFRRLFAMPLRRTTLYQAKQASVLLLVALSFALLALGVLAAGWVLRATHPGLGFGEPAPVGLLLRLALFGALSSFFLLAVQTWVSLVRRDFAAPIALAVLATVALLALRSLDASWLPYHPWAYPGGWWRDLAGDRLDPAWWLAGAAGGALFSVVAGWSFGRRGVF